MICRRCRKRMSAADRELALRAFDYPQDRKCRACCEVTAVYLLRQLMSK